MVSFKAIVTYPLSRVVVAFFCLFGAFMGYFDPAVSSRLLGVLVGMAWFTLCYGIVWVGYRFYRSLFGGV